MITQTAARRVTSAASSRGTGRRGPRPRNPWRALRRAAGPRRRPLALRQAPTLRGGELRGGDGGGGFSRRWFREADAEEGAAGGGQKDLSRCCGSSEGNTVWQHCGSLPTAAACAEQPSIHLNEIMISSASLRTVHSSR